MLGITCSSLTVTHECVGKNYIKPPRVAHLPALKEERENSFFYLNLLYLNCHHLYSLFCYKNFQGKGENVFNSSASSCGYLRKGLNSHCAPVVIALKCCGGEGGEAIFS